MQLDETMEEKKEGTSEPVAKVKTNVGKQGQFYVFTLWFND